jgi:hypothetical protein
MVDSSKSYTQTGYTDFYTIQESDNPLNIVIRSKWLGQELLNLNIMDFTSGLNSSDPSKWITLRYSFKTVSLLQPVKFYSALNSTGSNHQTGCVFPYDASLGRHTLVRDSTPHNQFSDTPVYYRNKSVDRIVATFYDEDENLVDFGGNKYFLSMSATFGKTNPQG